MDYIIYRIRALLQIERANPVTHSTPRFNQKPPAGHLLSPEKNTDVNITMEHRIAFSLLSLRVSLRLILT